MGRQIVHAVIYKYLLNVHKVFKYSNKPGEMDVIKITH